MKNKKLFIFLPFIALLSVVFGVVIKFNKISLKVKEK